MIDPPNLINSIYKTKHIAMKKIALLSVLALAAIITCTSCGKDEPEEVFKGIENISFDNYPKVDGSTSSNILNTLVACRMLNLSYEWMPPGITTEWTLMVNYEDLPEEHKSFFYERVRTSKTHGAFMNVIDGTADIIITPRTISANEKVYADSLGVTLIETPIASDAFVFMVNKNNPVKSLTIEQVQKIYTGEITNWSQVGGNNADIQVFTRPRDSGSEETLRELVMDGLEPGDFPASAIGGMMQVFGEILYNEDAICYTFNNYKELQARVPNSEVPVIAINGVYPSRKTVKNGTYPFIPKICVAIRSDLDQNSMAYKLYEWLQSDYAKSTITESGYVTE
jgi:phosphate transport system substrate-binding protein